MRIRIVLAGLLIASPAVAAVTDDEAMATPCRAYLASRGTPLFGALQDAIVTRLSASPNGGRFGSACNMGDYVASECKAHPTDDVRRAVDRLERDGASGRLPRIPMCGA